MKLVKCLMIYGVMFALMFGAWQTLGAQSAGDTTLTGTWKFNARSTMVLTDVKSKVTGTWQEAVGSEACPVTGTDNNGIINLHVSCRNYRYDLKLEGLASLTNNTVRGTTDVHGTTLQNDLVPGKFTMERVQ